MSRAAGVYDVSVHCERLLLVLKARCSNAVAHALRPKEPAVAFLLQSTFRPPPR